MLNWFKDLFSETSDVSMTRFLSFISVVSAVVIAFASVVQNSDLSDATMLCSAFLAAGFTGKVLQRSVEVTEAKNELESKAKQELGAQSRKAHRGQDE